MKKLNRQNWYALRTRIGRELRVQLILMKTFDAKKIQGAIFVPLQRTSRSQEKPLFPGFVYVQVDIVPEVQSLVSPPGMVETPRL